MRWWIGFEFYSLRTWQNADLINMCVVFSVARCFCVLLLVAALCALLPYVAFSCGAFSCGALLVASVCSFLTRRVDASRRAAPAITSACRAPRRAPAERLRSPSACRAPAGQPALAERLRANQQHTMLTKPTFFVLISEIK